MKKIILSIFAMVVACSTVSAKILDFGVTAGANIIETEVSGDNANTLGWAPDAKSGWFAGLQMKVTMPVIGLGFDAAVTYAQNEMTMKKTGNAVGTTDLSKFNKEVGYITVPVHLRWDINLPLAGNVAAPFVFTGPQASYALSKFEDDLNSAESVALSNYKTEDFVWKWDLGLGVILLNHLQASYAYEFPLTNVSSLEGVAKNLETDYKQGTHRIGLTYFF